MLICTLGLAMVIPSPPQRVACAELVSRALQLEARPGCMWMGALRVAMEDLLSHSLAAATTLLRQRVVDGMSVQAVGQLIGVDVAQAVLNVRVDYELRQAEDLAAEVEGVAEARLFALLGRERLDGLEVEVVVEVQVIQVLQRKKNVQSKQ